MSIDRYVISLHEHLTAAMGRGGDPSARRAATRQADDLAEEVRSHLEEAARDLQLAGISPGESERRAVGRFGPPDEIATALARSCRRERPRARPVAGLLVAAALMAVLGGSAVATAYAAPRHSGSSVGVVSAPRGPVIARPVPGVQP